MSDPWLAVLSKLNLSKAEESAVKRFREEPEGRSFLPLADILRSHNRVDESIELLMQGVDRHPTFAVARVVLARELLAKGLIAQAFLTLENSPVSVTDNALAQKLRFRLAILCGLEDLARTTYQHLREHQMLDDETGKLGDLLMVSSLARTKDTLVNQYAAKGHKLMIPEPGELDGGFADPEPMISDSSAEEIDLGASYGQDETLRNFHVVPLNEVFHGEMKANSQNQDAANAAAGVELDSTTLADIYARQGHYTKALAIYRRLLRLTPNNEFLQRKAKEYSKLEKEQRADDLAVDPTVVDQLEALEIIDSQVAMFNSLLDKLN